MEFVNVNGKILPAEEAMIGIGDGAFRSGMGLIETMKMDIGEIFLNAYHLDRLFEGVRTLKMNHHPIMIKKTNFTTDAIDLAEKNNCGQKVKVRITLSPGTGLVYENEEGLNYIIECSSLKEEKNKDLSIDIFPGGRKSCDDFSHLKTTSRLLYTMAEKFAKENGLDDCLVLNSRGRVCDSAISNIFWIKDEKIFTPPLSEDVWQV
jgi:branched-chain amino acid aminotransferase